MTAGRGSGRNQIVGGACGLHRVPVVLQGDPLEETSLPGAASLRGEPGVTRLPAELHLLTQGEVLQEVPELGLCRPNGACRSTRAWDTASAGPGVLPGVPSAPPRSWEAPRTWDSCARPGGGSAARLVWQP